MTDSIQPKDIIRTFSQSSLFYSLSPSLSPPSSSLSSSLLSFWVVSPGSALGGFSQAELQQCVGGLTSYPFFPFLSPSPSPRFPRSQSRVPRLTAVFWVWMVLVSDSCCLASPWPGHSILKKDCTFDPSTLQRVGHSHSQAFGQLSHSVAMPCWVVSSAVTLMEWTHICCIFGGIFAHVCVCVCVCTVSCADVILCHSSRAHFSPPILKLLHNLVDYFPIQAQSIEFFATFNTFALNDVFFMVKKKHNTYLFIVTFNVVQRLCFLLSFTL